MAHHVAIIMDGNGRWASARGLPRIAGHREGARAVRRTIEAAIQAGVSWLTIYAFSSENWRRPAGEILDLTGLLRRYLRTEIAELKQNGVRLRFIGERDRFDPDIQTRSGCGGTRYGRQHAAEPDRSPCRMAPERRSPRRRGRRLRPCRPERSNPSDLGEEVFARFLATAGMPDPDLIIRTSGEQRLSNFLLWQAAYAELVFLDVLWPDFDAAHFNAALAEYARRERRFGAR